MALSVALAADHGGLALKNELLPWLRSLGYAVTDVGAATFDPSDDYPDYAEAVGRAVISRAAQRGILVCGSGVGACIAANKLPGVRACLCHDVYSAHQGVEHDDMNILCLGGRVVGAELAKDLVDAFLKARFSGEERHRRRVAKVRDLERNAAQMGGNAGVAASRTGFPARCPAAPPVTQPAAKPRSQDRQSGKPVAPQA